MQSRACCSHNPGLRNIASYAYDLAVGQNVPKNDYCVFCYRNMDNTGTRETRWTELDYFQIVFVGIKDHYVLDAGGLECTFELPDLFNACCDDWVGIFPVGWSTTSDKIYFLKVNLPDNYQSGKACTCRLQFIG